MLQVEKKKTAQNQNKMKIIDFRRLQKSFRYASKGVIEIVKTEQNIRLHVLMALVVVFLMFFFRTELIEKTVLVLSIVLVLLAETVNSILERVVDAIRPRLHPEAKIMKDIMAAMVLVSAIGAFIVGLIIFIPKVVEKILEIV